MSTQSSMLSPNASSRISSITMPAMKAAFRIGVGLLFMQHGAQKLFGWLGGMNGEGATAAVFSQMGVAGVLEFFGGLMIVTGLLTRPVSLILAAEMVIAYFMVHAPQGSYPILNGGELALLYALSFTFLATTGAGEWSLDGLLSRRTVETRDEQRQRNAVAEHRSPLKDRGREHTAYPPIHRRRGVSS